MADNTEDAEVSPGVNSLNPDGDLVAMTGEAERLIADLGDFCASSRSHTP